MVGRAAELDRIRTVLDDARRGRTAAVLVEGDAGAGKTTLLTAAADLAPAFVQLRACGVESEARLDHAGLLQVLGPVREHLAQVPSRQAAAVAAAVGWGTGPDAARPAAAPGGRSTHPSPHRLTEPAADRFLVGAGTMTTLALVAQRAPVLILVDDLQWLDRESAQALLFAARRLTVDAVAFLFAARAGEPLPAPVGGIDRLRIGGLRAADAAALLPPDTAAVVVTGLTAATGGNPLALLEAAASLTPAQRAGAAAIPEPLPVGDRLQEAYGRVLAGLSPGARRAVLLLAAGREQDEGPVAGALRAAGFDPGNAFDEAEAVGVLRTGPGAPRFRHPLLRAAAWRLATPAERREVHRSLAAHLSAQHPDRLWHLSAATTGHDDVLAEGLVAAAATMRTRRGFAASSAALERAAALTTDPARAAAHLAAAVDDAILAGDVDRARQLGERVLGTGVGADERSRAGALHALGIMEEFAGSVARAAQLQRSAADLGAGTLRARALAQLTMLCYRLDDPVGMRAAAETLASSADPREPEQRMLAAYSLGAAHVFDGDQAFGHDLVRQAMELLETEEALRDDPRYLLLALLVGRWLGDLAVMAPALDRRLRRAREMGALGALVPALSIMAAGRALRGDHAGAYADAGEAVELGESLGHASELALAYLVLAAEAAARGLPEDADRALAAARGLIERAGTTGVAEHLLRVEALCAEARGDLSRVLAVLEPRAAAAGGRSGYAGDRLPVAPLLVEAYLGLRRPADAARLADRYAAANPHPTGPAVTALVARCRALVAPDLPTAVDFFEAALAAHARGPDPVEAARTRLLYGARLRRAGRRLAAREQLRTARDVFAAMDFALWVNRANDELAATGDTRRRPTGGTEPLTSQETRVARLVAGGLTNREVAAALFLSPKTVEHHIGSVFRKRGLRSRTELALLFAHLDSSGGQPGATGGR
jgi:DNA-binding CsgD family transcriptional regulator